LIENIENTSLPGVSGTHLLTRGDCGPPGSRRLTCRTDGSTFVEEVLDESGTVICSASGRLSDSPRGTSVKGAQGRWTDNHWILEHCATDGDFWNAACTGIKMDHRRSYVLTVKLDQIDPRTPYQMLVPKIEGGGNELPERGGWIASVNWRLIAPPSL
jgi:hypothetical protein